MRHRRLIPLDLRFLTIEKLGSSEWRKLASSKRVMLPRIPCAPPGDLRVAHEIPARDGW